ncbi:MAG: thiol:disulfide interchange protein DsbD [Vicingaceae bacterium]|jgi:thiol:disulfide interchange protein DsbD
MRTLFLSILLFFSAIISNAQIFNPVGWKTEVKQLENGTFELQMTAAIEEGWHLYSQSLPSDDGPIATEFTFKESSDFERIGKVKEPKAKTEFDPNFDMDLNYFEKEVTFNQTIKSLNTKGYKVTAEVYFMVCDAEKCLPPEYVDFEFSIPASNDAAESSEEGETTGGVLENSDSEQLIGNSDDVSDDYLNATKWEYTSTKSDRGSYDFHFKGTIGEGWHLYSQKQSSEEEQVMATKFYLNKAMDPDTETKESGELISKFDPTVYLDLNYYENKVEFVRTVKGITGDKYSIEYEFIVCNSSMCFPPELIEVEFDLNTGRGINALEKTDLEANLDVESIIPYLPNVDLDNPKGTCVESEEDTQDVSNVWVVFFMGFIGGLIALLTPCVFPMIPLTVSFFTKGDGGGKGLGKAVLYGFFIFLIYAILSIPFHFNADPAVLSEIATSVVLNIIFFIVFVVFAISFFGYFEITLPASLTNKADSASQVGGTLGIFFMALTLALVSFSCTGPILGTVLGSALKNGPWPITAAMSGFGIALGLPFAVFAAFPSMMNKLPKSGGWLNAVKVVLGFIELALALKFFSNADLVEQWELVHRETFFLIWTIIFAGLTLYLFGLIKFPHDSPIAKLSPFRKAFGIVVLIFTIYIAPGVMKTPPWNHNLLSGFPPPTFYSWYEKETFHAPFDDFEEAMSEAKRVNKPLLIDFTGWACVNCRKMEESVWTVESIKEKLENDFVLVSLYVDDKVKLPEEQQGVFEYMAGNELKKKKIKTIGNKWATFQTQVFNNNSQPYYVMLSPDGYLLGNPVGYTPSIEEYSDFLDCGIEAAK